MEVTLDAVLAYWGVDMVLVGVISGLVFATTALVKKEWNLTGRQILLVSAPASAIWSIGVLLPMQASWSCVGATTIVAFITASGGWQAFKNILEKGGEKLGTFNKAPNALTDVKPGD